MDGCAARCEEQAYAQQPKGNNIFVGYNELLTHDIFSNNTAIGDDDEILLGTEYT